MKKPYFLISLLIAVSMNTKAQLCTNPKDTVYGLNSITGSGSGRIVAINVNNAGATNIGSLPASSNNANGLGFNQTSGLFYFFNQCSAGVTEFISFNPNTGSKVIKNNPVPAIPTVAAGKIRTGTINKGGTSYYTIFPAATTVLGYPANGPAFYHYNTTTNAWLLLSQVVKNTSGTDISATFTSLNSGDMAFDGHNNLWILCSNSTSYALYKINAPVPTTVQAFITVATMIPVTPTPSGAVSFTGVAFNSQGKMYLSTGSAVTPTAGVHNQLYEMATVGGPLVNKGTLPNGAGDDLTSCFYPVAVLATTWVDFTAALQNNVVKLGWDVNENDDITGYDIESSTDADHWQNIAHIDHPNSASEGVGHYSYSDNHFNQGANYYRIVQIAVSGKKEASVTRLVNTGKDYKVYLSPNPTKDILYFFHKDNSSKLQAQVFDKTGRLVYSTTVSQSQQSISVANLPRGVYILKLLSPDSFKNEKGYQFVKL